MAQKTPIDDNIITAPPVRLENVLVKGKGNIITEKPKITIGKAIRNSTIISIAVILVMAAAIFYAYIKINKMSSNLQEKQNLVYLANQQTQTGTNLIRQWNEISPKVKSINNSLPASTDLLGYMGMLETIAQNSGVTQNVKLQTTANPSAPVNLPNQAAVKGSSVDYTIELKGNLDQFANYMQLLEEAPYFTQVTDFNLVSSQGSADTATATIGAKVYTYP